MRRRADAACPANVVVAVIVDVFVAAVAVVAETSSCFDAQWGNGRITASTTFSAV